MSWYKLFLSRVVTCHNEIEHAFGHLRVLPLRSRPGPNFRSLHWSDQDMRDQLLFLGRLGGCALVVVGLRRVRCGSPPPAAMPVG